MNPTLFEDDKYKTPGQLIEERLASLGWTQRVLAIVLQESETGINKLVAGKQSLSAPLALLIGEVLGVTPERLLAIQKQYDLAQARITMRDDPARTTRAHLFGALPVTDMIKRGWLNATDVRDVPQVEAALKKFFGAPSLNEIEVLPHAAKKTNVMGDATPSQLAWLYRVNQIASEMLVREYSPQSVASALKQLKDLLSAPEETRKVPRILAEAGIRFVIVESLPGSKIDGVCFWLNESPVIGMSLRYDRIDNFWFVLRHELEHVIRLHGQQRAVLLDAELEGERAGTGADIAAEEREANAAAADFCVPKNQLEKFIARKAPFFAQRDLMGFSRTLQIHPGLVAGQLRHRLGRYDLFSAHLAKVRSHVAPSAMVDGWGDVAPVDN